jgi:hypothetical protein
MGIVTAVPPQQTTIIQANATVHSTAGQKPVAAPQGTQILVPPSGSIQQQEAAAAAGAKAPSSGAPIAPSPMPTANTVTGVPSTAPSTTGQASATVSTIPGLPPFQSIEKSLLPLSGNQIHQFRQLDRKTQDGANEPVVPVDGITQVITVDPDSGETPTIHLSAGYGCSLTVVDGAGQPWPIMSAAIGSGQRFNVTNIEKGHYVPTVVISDLLPHAQSNLLVTLEGLKTPIPIQLVSGGHIKDGHKVVDYRVILRVRGMAPGSLPSTFSASPNRGTTAALLQALYGTMPTAAASLKVEGAPAYSYTRAWLLNGQLWIRTHARLLAPAWIATESGANGATAYVLPKTHALLLHFDGRNTTVEVK